MQNLSITSQEDEAIGADRFEGKFSGFEDGECYFTPQKPTGEVLGKLLCQSMTGAIEAHESLGMEMAITWLVVIGRSLRSIVLKLAELGHHLTVHVAG
jgi:hypothetical protein